VASPFQLSVVLWQRLFSETAMAALRRIVKIAFGSPLLALLFSTGLPSYAQETSVFKEQSKLIRPTDDTVALGNDLFGDKVSLYTGGLEFIHNDVSLPGNSKLPVAVGRRFQTGSYPVNGKLFGNWDIEVPHLHGVFASSGWTAARGTDPLLRCSHFGEPLGVSSSQGIFQAKEFWHGNYLYIPGEGDQEMLARDPRYTQQPSGATHPVVTRRNWAVRCLPGLAPGSSGSGEGFVAVSPDGTSYRFDWMVSRPLESLTKANYDSSPAIVAPGGETTATTTAPTTSTNATVPGGDPTPELYAGGIMSRVEVWMLPTSVTDRFGNVVTYTYDTVNKWQLKTITSTELNGTARTITLTYLTPGATTSNLVTTVSDGTRLWRYNYNGTGPSAGLTSVTLPDNSAWTVGGLASLQSGIEYLGEGGCEEPGTLAQVELTGTMVHPSGAQGSFKLASTRHGLAGVEYKCPSVAPGSPQSPYWSKLFDNFALTEKVLSGPGINGNLRWATSYSAAQSSWAPCNSCDSTKTVTVTDPQGDAVVSTFGTLFRENEGQLIQTTLTDNGNTLRSTSMTYVPVKVDPGALTDAYGISDQDRGNGLFAARVIEMDRRTITQQSVNFVWQANNFNAFAQPAQIVRSSSLGSSRTENNTYHNNLSKWVLGLPATVTESPSGKVMVSNAYNATTSNLESVTSFGHLQKSMTYNADGTMAGIVDAQGHGLTFGNYRRGVPQSVGYKTSAITTVYETAVVSNIGKVTSFTDRAGFTTAYGYDSMGRMATITYPTADTVAWNATTISTTQSPSIELQIPANHWRQAITTGQAHQVKYFDAFMRPLYVERWDNSDVAGTMRIVKYNYDHQGRVTFESYPKRSFGQISDGVTSSYDALGRPTARAANSEIGTLFTSTFYSGNFEKVVVDPRGNNAPGATKPSTKFRYQVFDEPVESAITNITAPENVVVDITRDIFGKTKSITRSGSSKSATRSLCMTPKNGCA
jgi:YD repeat-containing protein